MLIVVQTLSSRSVITTTDVSSVGIRLSQSNSDSTRLAPTLQSIFSFIDVCYALCIMPMMPPPTVVMRSLLAHHYNPVFVTYRGDYTEFSPARIVNHDCKQSHILPVTRAITKHNTSGESIAMDLKTFSRVSLIHPFGRHMPVGPSGIQFSAAYGYHQLAEHTVLASFHLILVVTCLVDLFLTLEVLCNLASPHKPQVISLYMMGSKA